MRAELRTGREGELGMDWETGCCASESPSLLPLYAEMRPDGPDVSSLSTSTDMLVDVEKADSREAAEWMPPFACIRYIHAELAGAMSGLA